MDAGAAQSGAEHARRDPPRALRPQRHRHRPGGLHLRQPPGQHGAGQDLLAARQHHLDARQAIRSRPAATSNTCEQRGARRQLDGRVPRSTRNTNNPLDTGFAYSNALLGVFSQYTETDKYRETRNRAWMSEFYAQDTFSASSRLTLDYGARFLWYTPVREGGRPGREFRSGAVRSGEGAAALLPAIVNGDARRVRSGDRTDAERDLHRRVRAGHRRSEQRHGRVPARACRAGFRETLAPQIEPRLGVDLGSHRQRRDDRAREHGRVSQRAARRRQSREPERQSAVHPQPDRISTAPSARCSARARPSLINPPTVEAITPDYKTPAGLQLVGRRPARHRLGHGRGRHLRRERRTQHGDVLRPECRAEQARYLDIHPENRDPTGNATALLPPQFLRPYRGYQNIRVRGNSGDGELSFVAGDGQPPVHQGASSSAAPTPGSARSGVADEDPGNLSMALDRPLDFYYGILAQSQTHNLSINYTWDIPGNHGRRGGPAARTDGSSPDRTRGSAASGRR